MLNQLKTVLLLGLLSALLIGIGGAMGKNYTTIAVFIAVAMNLGAYFFSDKMVLAMHRAREVGPNDLPNIRRITEELAHRAKIPTPRLYIIEDPQPNAFATGRNPQHGVVALSTGILQLLDERQLRGVIAHEMAHIMNRDILVSSVAAMLAAVISYLGHIASYALMFGGRSQDDERGNGAGGLLMLFLAPLAATLIQLGISRSREYLADETGARLALDPEGLATALEKLHRTVKLIPTAHPQPATASLFIVNPFAGAGRGMMNLFSTHPPFEERVRRLRGLKIALAA